MEITTPDVTASARFYAEQFGMRAIHEHDGRVYLRCWGDYYTYSVVLVEGPEPALRRMAWRTASPEALEETAARVEAAGITGAWTTDTPGVSRAYEFTGPYGHPMRLFYEVEKFAAEPEFRSIYPDRPEKRSTHAGAPRFLDHVTVAATDVPGFCAWCSETLGFRTVAFTDLEEAPITVFGVVTTNEKSMTWVSCSTPPTGRAGSITSPSGSTPTRNC
ncbi:VOC family protein [Nocardia sp. NPDC005366]|uniref:VOC family protein n=1 Tax=Nocardia sp. NPDC005366 TaxID=3156878 RepID=UPI0033BBF757